jgi:cysteine desulfurase/selenocysteine lyase
VLMSTASYTTGFRPPLDEISRHVHERGGLLYLDGTQGIGALKFDVQRIQPDMLAVHGYKWLLSPNGAGFMYVSPELRKRLRPTVIGWRSDKRWREVATLHHGAPEFVEAAEKYEGGMLNFPSLYAMGASVQMMLDLGTEVIEARVLDLAKRCAEALEAEGGEVEFRGTPILAARFQQRDAVELARKLRRDRILVSARHGRLRVSVHFYNDESDLERLRNALR